MVNMMSNDDNCFVCGRKGNIGHCCPQAQCYNCDDFCHFAQDCPEKLPHQAHTIIKIDLTPTQIITTASDTGHYPSITEAGKGTALPGQDHTIDPRVADISSHHWRHASHSVSHHHSHSQYPSTDRYP